ncbi:MAG: 2-dehydropantoate 2-reductase N-terminal domain-containing protein [bacterium]|nr:2-dehydropantoate 2-reductase N-terminal domain-containing protein [bacterium]
MRVFVVDTGEMGTSSGAILARAGHEVTLLIQPYDSAQRALYLNLRLAATWAKNTNYIHLPGVELPENIEFADNFKNCANADVILLAVPSKFLWSAIENIKPYLESNPKCILTLLTKGFDSDGQIPVGLKLKNNLLLTLGYKNFAIISGYTPASYLANAYLTGRVYAASVASYDLNIIKKLKRLFKGSGLGLIGTRDVVGSALGGALKNAYAIGYGILRGLNKSDEAWAYLNLALCEMKIFLDYAGAKSKTLESPAVKADFRLTSIGEIDWESRNVTFGKYLAEYHTAEEIKAYVQDPKHTVEGYESMKTLWQIAQDNKLYTPLLHRIHAICEFIASPGTLSLVMKN